MDENRVREIVSLNPSEFAKRLSTLTQDEIWQLDGYIRARIQEIFNENVIDQMKLLDYSTGITKLHITLFNDAHTRKIRNKINEYMSYLQITFHIINWLLTKWNIIEADSELVNVNMMLMDHYRPAIAQLAEAAVVAGTGDSIFSTIADLINNLPPIPRIICLLLASVAIYVVASNIGGKDNARYAMQHMASMSGCDTSKLEKAPSFMVLAAKMGTSFMSGGVKALAGPGGNSAKSTPSTPPQNPSPSYIQSTSNYQPPSQAPPYVQNPSPLQAPSYVQPTGSYQPPLQSPPYVQNPSPSYVQPTGSYCGMSSIQSESRPSNYSTPSFNSCQDDDLYVD